jgi:hypothetical protein
MFSKYSDEEKAKILWKFSAAVTIVGLVLSIVGVALDRYDYDDEIKLQLDGMKVTIPSVTISSTRIILGIEGCKCPKDNPECNPIKFNPDESALFSSTGTSFKELAENPSADEGSAFFTDVSKHLIAETFMGSFDSMYKRGLASRILAFFGVIMQVIALGWSMYFKVGPASFLNTRPLFGQTAREHRLGSIYMLLLVLSAMFLFTSNIIMSTFVIPLLTRVANLALSWCKDSPFNSLPRQQTDLKYTLFLGDYVQDSAEATGASFMTYAVAIGLVFCQVMFVTYLGLTQVLSVSRVRYHLPKTQLSLLPWYAKIPPISISLVLLVVGIIAKCGAAYSARVRGYDLNMFFYRHALVDNEDVSSQSWSLPDLILDNTHKYVMDDSIVNMVYNLWVPIVAVLGFGTIDYAKYISKIIQIIGTLLILSAIVSVVSVPPTPTFILQKPQCFRPPNRPPSFAEFFSMSYSCNDQLFSVHAVIIMVPAMMLYFSIRYGQVSRKLFAYTALVILALASLLIIVATRQQYTVDVYIGALVTVLVSLSQSAAFKLLLRFGVVHPGLTEKPAIILSEKLVPMLDDVIKRLELHFMAGDRAEPITRDEMDIAKAEFERLSENIAMAKQQAIQSLAPDLGLTEDEGFTSMGESEDAKNKDV